MAGKPREDRSTIKKNFVAVRLDDHEMAALTKYRNNQDVAASPAEIIRVALRAFLTNAKRKS
jgi:hypothetical protein